MHAKPGAAAELLVAAAEAHSDVAWVVSRAEAEYRAGETRSAQDVLASAQSIATEVGAGPSSEIGLSLARVRALAEHAGR